MNQMFPYRWLFLLFVFVLPIQALSPDEEDRASFEELEETVAALGHRNWILVADSAYPAQTGEGVRVIVTGMDHAAMVEAVNGAIANSPALRPRVYFDAEFAFVPEEFAPGTAALREEIVQIVGEGTAEELAHEELIARVQEVSDQFEVVVFKTKGTIPYSSVFYELECGYWSDEAEAALRAAMAAE